MYQARLTCSSVTTNKRFANPFMDVKRFAISQSANQSLHANRNRESVRCLISQPERGSGHCFAFAPIPGLYFKRYVSSWKQYIYIYLKTRRALVILKVKTRVHCLWAFKERQHRQAGDSILVLAFARNIVPYTSNQNQTTMVYSFVVKP